MSGDSPVICDFFIDRDGVEYIAEVFSTDEGFVEEFSVYVLQEDGSKGDTVESEPFFDAVQRKYVDWVYSTLDDGRDSYPASHY